MWWMSAPPWFMNLVKLMPNLVGSIARPRFRHLLAALKASTPSLRASRRSRLDPTTRGDRHSSSENPPNGTSSPALYVRLAQRFDGRRTRREVP